MEALRTYKGQYSPTKMQEATAVWRVASLRETYGGAASSLLRDIYLGNDRRVNGCEAPCDMTCRRRSSRRSTRCCRDVADGHANHGAGGQSGGRPETTQGSYELSGGGGQKEGPRAAVVSEDRIEEILREGNFYHALAEFLVDLPNIPFACIKGRQVKILPEVKWRWPAHRRATPDGVVADCAVQSVVDARCRHSQRQYYREIQADTGRIERSPGPAGVRPRAVRAVLEDYGRGGLYDNWDTTNCERAVLESREPWNRRGLVNDGIPRQYRVEFCRNTAWSVFPTS